MGNLVSLLMSKMHKMKLILDAELSLVLPMPKIKMDMNKVHL